MLIGMRDKRLSVCYRLKTWIQPSQLAFQNFNASSLTTARAPGIWRRCDGLTASLARHVQSLANLTVLQLARRLYCAAGPVRKIRLSLPGRLCNRVICRFRRGFGARTS